MMEYNGCVFISSKYWVTMQRVLNFMRDPKLAHILVSPCTAGARRGFHLVRRLHLNSEVVVGRAGAWCILGATRPLSQDQREEGV